MNIDFDYKRYKEYFFSLKRFIIISAAFFVFSIIYGYFSAYSSPEEAKNTLIEFEKIFASVLESSTFMQFIFIFLNNTFSLFLSIALGLVFGIAPFIYLFSNGMLLGVFVFLWQQEFALSEFLIGILPHGIIEIPLLIVSAAIGLKIGKAVIDKVFKKKGEVKPEVKIGLDFFIKVMIPLALIAAAVEAYITPLFF